MIIALEGIDASGKETQAKMLRSWASREMDQFQHVVGQDFPDYETQSGKLIKELLEKDLVVWSEGSSGNPYAKAMVLQSLMLTNRLEHYELLKSYSNTLGRLLVLDRYYGSGLVYGSADGLELDWLLRIHSALPSADYWLFVDISVEESFRRRPERRDLYEEDKEKLEQIRRRYREAFENMNRREPGRWLIVDGEGSETLVHERIITALRKASFGLLFGEVDAPTV